MNNKINYEIDNCTTDLDTLIALDKRAIRDLENNTHEIEQHEVLTIIREFIRLRNDYKQEKNKINTIKKLMSIGDVTDEALFTLVQTTMAELERLEDIEEQLDKEKEKNKTKVDIKDIEFSNFIKERYVSKDKIKEKIEQAKQKADDDNLDEYIKISAWKELLEEK